MGFVQSPFINSDRFSAQLRGFRAQSILLKEKRNKKLLL